MTRERVKELLPVLQAFAEGKPFQYKAIDTGRWCDWDYNICSNCPFEDNVEYRITPECDVQKENHYRPFKDCDELKKHYLNLYKKKVGFIPVDSGLDVPYIWVKSKEYGTDNLITAFDCDNESIGGSCVSIQEVWIDMKELFNYFTFLDGSVCGKEK